MALTSDAAEAAREGAPHTAETARSVLAEFLDAMRSTAYGIFDEQKGRAAQEVADIADAVRCSARSLEESRNPAVARYVERAALGIDHFAETMRQRSWHEILAEAEEFAQRRPALFVLGAIAAGFAAGCLASLPAPGGPSGASREEPAPSAEAERPSSLPAAAIEPEPAHRSARRGAKDGV